MEQQITRRDFIYKSAIVGGAVLSSGQLYGGTGNEPTFPIDYHVHLTKDFTIEKALELSKKRKVKFGIVEHPGNYSGIKTDKDMEAYIKNLRQYPVHIGMQPVRRNWSKDFSTKVVEQLDYVLMDADTIPLDNGKYLEIWRHNNYIEDVDYFMSIYMKHIEDLLKNEYITIFARPTYLPVNFARYYDKLWTEERMMTIIDLAKKKGIAMEISTPMHVPNPKFIKLAKAKGLKFTFGTNARNDSAGKLHYGLKMMKECNLTSDDFLIL